ncbi:ORF MSV221 hypothetical protein [Melanoplus sanguinipes entomopoxvirus]|uniref:Uncharacterized protein n=1 Tax=Melanoplus sanguinipes entomopoxvirus TaxID=83191 RepID=Q9YVM1_MSEPV|nr:ORF MSV221 hypothetical protein [Melanoplus sanguinipes entomopoxvirus]AAC97706.1 ORF MSV221 hypothetical protein [Melanoplus sanguinipes entomopoxvirus 'O']
MNFFYEIILFIISIIIKMNLTNACNDIINYLNNIDSRLLKIFIKNKTFISGSFVSYMIAINKLKKNDDIDLYCSDPDQLIKDFDDLNIHSLVNRFNNTINYFIKYNTELIKFQIIYAKISSLKFIDNYDISLTKVAYVTHENYIYLSEEFKNDYNKKEFHASDIISNYRYNKYESFARLNYNSQIKKIKFDYDYKIDYYNYINKCNTIVGITGIPFTYSMELLDDSIKCNAMKGCILSDCKNKSIKYICKNCIEKLKFNIVLDNEFYNKHFIVFGAATRFGNLIFEYLSSNVNNCIGTSYWYESESKNIIKYNLEHEPSYDILEKILASDIVILSATKLGNTNEIYYYKNIVDHGIDKNLLMDRFNCNVIGYLNLLYSYMKFKIDKKSNKKQIFVYIDNYMSEFNDNTSHPEFNIVKVAQKRVIYQFEKPFNKLNINILIYNIGNKYMPKKLNVYILMKILNDIIKKNEKIDNILDTSAIQYIIKNGIKK